MSFYKQTPLLMFPNGTIARSKTMIEGCIVVEEPELEVVPEIWFQSPTLKKPAVVAWFIASFPPGKVEAKIKEMKDNNELTLEVELIKKDIHDIKNNHLQHIEADMRDVKIEVFRFKYVIWGALVIFILMTDKFTQLLRLL